MRVSCPAATLTAILLCNSIGAASFVDLPADEQALAATIGLTGADDSVAYAHGKSDGQIAVVMQEDHEVRSVHSSDSGATFATEVPVAGGGAQPQVAALRTALSPDGTLYAVTTYYHPGGSFGVQASSSLDMGQSWSGPVDVVVPADLGAGAWPWRYAFDVTAAPSGQVAVVFRQHDSTYHYVAVSSDSGQTWSAPVRIDAGATSADSVLFRTNVDIMFATNGTLHVAWTQARSGSRRSVWYARSTDGGSTFQAEQNLELVAHATNDNSQGPSIAEAGDGSILVAFTDYYSTNFLYVLRSVDGGASFVKSAEFAASPSSTTRPILRSFATSEVILAFAGTDAELELYRSADNGASFPTVHTISSAALGNQFDLQRTPDGNWAIAWADGGSDGYAGYLTDVLVRVSTDGGATWNASQRANGGLPGEDPQAVAEGSLACVGTDDLLVAFTDGRDDSRRSRNVYANRGTAASLSFGTDQRIDADAAQVNVHAYDSDVATDGANSVYVAMEADGDGPYSDIYVTASTDGGYSFGAPVRVGSFAAGSRVNLVPQVHARPGGAVYLVFLSDDPAGGREVRFNRSLDNGQTWLAQDHVLGSAGQPFGPGNLTWDFDTSDVQLAVESGGRVYVAWSDGTDIFVAHSADNGGSFTVEADVDGSLDPAVHPAMCADDDQLVLAFVEYAAADDPVYGTTSQDGGATWSTPTILQSAGAGSAYRPFVACNDAAEAIVTWSEVRSTFYYEVYASRWTGSAWSGDQLVPGPTTESLFGARPVYSSATDVNVVFEGSTSVYAARSDDGAATFIGYQQLDLGAPEPAKDSGDPRAVADGGGNLWVAWEEKSVGPFGSVVLVHSADHGATYGSVLRANDDSPHGARNTYYSLQTTLAAGPGVGYLSFGAPRASLRREALVVAYDLDDLDRDQVAAGSDCADDDPGVQAPPTQVASLAVEQISGVTRLSWVSQAPSAGPGTAYDVVSGDLTDLRSSGDYLASNCLVDDHPEPPFDDSQPNPSPGGGWYYLVRADNTCAAGSFGDSGLVPDPRADLDANSPCP